MFFNQPAIIPAFLNLTNNESFIFSQKMKTNGKLNHLNSENTLKHAMIMVCTHDWASILLLLSQDTTISWLTHAKSCRRYFTDGEKLAVYSLVQFEQIYNSSTKNLKILIQKREEGLRQTLLDKESWNDGHKRVQNHAADQLRRIPSRAALLCRREFQGNSISP